MLEGILALIRMIQRREASIQNRYRRFVPSVGNERAREMIYSVFRESDAEWRGLGTIGMSGLSLGEAYAAFDAEQFVDFSVDEIGEPKGCICGSVIKGVAQPLACPLYKKVCTPSNPVGPCMVSSEGTCAAYYKYSGHGKRDTV
jgi:hydrogenase expression/formation protein HypD